MHVYAELQPGKAANFREFRMISMDVRSLVDTDTTLTLFDNLFVPVSCAISNVSAMKTGVHWGKWYSFFGNAL